MIITLEVPNTPKEVEEAMSYIYDSFIARLEKAEEGCIHLFRFSVDVSRRFFRKTKFPISPTCVVVRKQECIDKVAVIDRGNVPFKVQ